MKASRLQTAGIILVLAHVVLPYRSTLAAQSGSAVATTTESATRQSATTKSGIRAAYLRTPLRFDVGDCADAEFIGHAADYQVALANGTARFIFAGTDQRSRVEIAMRLVGASGHVRSEARMPLPGVTNYFIGRDPTKWRRGVRSYGEIFFRDVYPGVDVVYYGNQQQLEYDFRVAPDADVDTIALAFEGSSGLSINPVGELVVSTAAGILVAHAPAIYQERDGQRDAVAGGYELRGDERVGFWVGDYDAHRPLVIDPWISYGSYLGGSREERVVGVGFDGGGNMFLSGLTAASDFPQTGSTDLKHGRDNSDAFVVKLDATGSQFLCHVPRRDRIRRAH